MRVYKPKLTIYPEVGRAIENISIYTSNELVASKFWVSHTTLSTNIYTPHPVVDLVTLSRQVVFSNAYISTGFQDLTVAFPRENHPDGDHFRYYINNGQGHVYQLVSTPVVTSRFPVTSYRPDGTATSLALTAYTIVTAYLDVASAYTSNWTLISSNGTVPEYQWIPDYDPSVTISIYQSDPLPNLVEIKTNLSSAARPYVPEREVFVFMWEAMKRMKRTLVSSRAYIEDRYHTDVSGKISWYIGEVVENVSTRDTFQLGPQEPCDVRDQMYVIKRRSYEVSLLTNQAITYPLWVPASHHDDPTQVRHDLAIYDVTSQSAQCSVGGYERYISTGLVAFVAYKHPDASGEIRGLAVLLYDSTALYDRYWWYTPEVRSWAPYNDNNRHFCAQSINAGAPTAYEIPVPDPVMVDEGEFLHLTAENGTSSVMVSFPIDKLPTVAGPVGYDHRSTLSADYRGQASDGSDIICGPIHYGHSYYVSMVRGTRSFDFFWEWDFNYAAE